MAERPWERFTETGLGAAGWMWGERVRTCESPDGGHRYQRQRVNTDVELSMSAGSAWI